MRAKYRYVEQKKLGGIGIFALGYDHGHDALWSELKNSFCTPASLEP